MKAHLSIKALLSAIAQAEKAKSFPGEAGMKLLLWLDKERQTVAAIANGTIAGGEVEAQLTDVDESFGFGLDAIKGDLTSALGALTDPWVDVELIYSSDTKLLRVISEHHGINYAFPEVLPLPEKPKFGFTQAKDAKVLKMPALVLHAGIRNVAPMLGADMALLDGFHIHTSTKGTYITAGSQAESRWANSQLEVDDVSDRFAATFRQVVLETLTSAAGAMLPPNGDLINVDVTITVNPDDTYMAHACLEKDSKTVFCVNYRHHSLPGYPKEMLQRFDTKTTAQLAFGSSFVNFSTSFAGMNGYVNDEGAFVALNFDKTLRAIAPTRKRGTADFATGCTVEGKAFRTYLAISDLSLVVKAMNSARNAKPACLSFGIYDDSVVIKPLATENNRGADTIYVLSQVEPSPGVVAGLDAMFQKEPPRRNPKKKKTEVKSAATAAPEKKPDSTQKSKQPSGAPKASTRTVKKKSPAKSTTTK